MKSIDAQIAQLQEVNRLAAAGKYDDAESLYHKGPPTTDDDHRNFREWRDAVRQEFAELREPTLDLRAYVLEKVGGVRSWRYSGLDPADLYRFSFDARINRESLKPVVEKLVEEGMLVFRRKKLWTPDQWKAQSDARKHATAEARRSASIL